MKLLVLKAKALSTNRRRCMLEDALYEYTVNINAHINIAMSELESSTQSHTDKTNYAGRTIYQLSPLMIMLSRPGAAPPPAASITHTSPGTSSAPARATRTS